ncbi:MAG TPA: nucleotide excision repair endonuclease [Verrucomicrobiae bacterium]|nr:nucleotide excision repair endonuclease [Verrucomicrobiae bacterium]
MPPIQQRLFPDPQPLVERLGREFFRRLPETPGVYLMHSAAGDVLYVGKAKSLRHRLGSYRVANPERMARRTLRLLRLVDQITLEPCADEQAALRRESELLRSLKPRFNRAGVWQGPSRFVAWRVEAGRLELAVHEKVEASWSAAGPFGAQAEVIHRALVRLLWCRFYPQLGLAGMPSGWVHGQHGLSVMIPAVDAGIVVEASERLDLLARGGEHGFPEWLPPVSAPYEQPVRDEDVEFVLKHLTGRLVSR